MGLLEPWDLVSHIHSVLHWRVGECCADCLGWIGSLLGSLNPLVGSLSALLLSLRDVVDNLLELVQEILDGLLTGLSIGLAGLIL